jgi:5'-methylthioadenosine phosphorylase
VSTPSTASGPGVGVIGGSGLYALLDDVELITVETPYGPPSAPVTVGTVDGYQIAFLPRHGRQHQFPPHRIPYRANLWALRAVGVRQILAPCAVGGLRPELGPGTFVLPDQVVDRTTGRIQTFHDSGAAHIAFADPYCPDGRAAVRAVAAETGLGVVDGGTMVVVEGPRFSSRAESRWYSAQGWSVVNMTGLPEAVLARELALCYTSIALVTDLDAGVEAGEEVTQEEVFRVFAENTDRMRALVLTTAAQLAPRSAPGGRRCVCAHALDGIDLQLELP